MLQSFTRSGHSGYGPPHGLAVKEFVFWAVVVAQFGEGLLPNPDIRGWNPVMGNLINYQRY